MALRSSRSLTLLAATAGLAFALAGCASGSASDTSATDASTETDLGTEANPVKLGVVGASDPYWDTYKQVVEDAGISIDIIDFTDYAQPNPALSSGELDINQFQHIIYLADYNVNAGDTLVPIGATAIYPLGLYSTKYDSTDAIPDGETVIVPNDDTNLARGLLVLQSAGLIELKDGGSPFSTLEDIDKDASRVQVTAVDAALTAGSLNDAAAAIINNDFVEDAGLSFDDAIAKDDPNEESAFPYINIFATTDANKDNPVLNKLVELYQGSQAVLDGVQEASGGTAVFATNSAEELQKSLADVQSELEAQ